MKHTFLLLVCFAFLIIENKAQTIVTDIDENTYNTVTIGTQLWMKETLKTTHYKNGNDILKVSDSTIWINNTTPAFCWYDNDSLTYANNYGALYNWYAVNTANICPVNWHVPTLAEWDTLETFLGGDMLSGGKIKDTNTLYWCQPNVGAVNSSGFSCLPGGIRIENASYTSMCSAAFIWSSTEHNVDANKAEGIHIYSWNSYLYIMPDIKNCGLSVRCIKDNNSSINDLNNNINFNIHPNPSIDKVNITCKGHKNYKMQIVNSLGETVLQAKLNNTTNEINVSSLPNGLYIIMLTGEDWFLQKKLIKE